VVPELEDEVDDAAEKVLQSAIKKAAEKLRASGGAAIAAPEHNMRNAAPGGEGKQPGPYED
jgi:hypothetical protein